MDKRDKNFSPDIILDMENIPQPRFTAPKPPKSLANSGLNENDVTKSVEPAKKTKVNFDSVKPIVEQKPKPVKPVKPTKPVKEPRVQKVKEVKTVTQKPTSLFENRKLPKGRKTITSLICAIVMFAGLSGYLAYDKITTESEIASIQSTISSQQAQLAEETAAVKAKEGNIQALTNENAQLKKDVATKDSLLDARVGFVEVLAPLNEAVASAVNKVDVTANVTVVDAAREAVFAERENVNKIKAQKEIVVEQTKLITDAVTAWQVADDAAKALQAEQDKAAEALKAEQDALKAQQDVGVGTAAKAALVALAGETVTMTIVEAPCGSTDAKVAACVNSTEPTNIQVSSAQLDKDQTTWNMIMAHEYSHVIQFRDYAKFTASPAYSALFNSDPEWYSDCMAMAKIGATYTSGYGYQCSPEQLAVATKAWSGDFT
jgi:cell division protein FtsL